MKLSQSWNFRVEYLYTNLGDTTLTTSGLTNLYDIDFHTLRAGLTPKF